MVCNRILIHFTSARMEISVHQQFQDPGELCERATHTSRSEFCLVLAENIWPPHSKSARSQVSTALFYVRTVQAWICTDDMQASCLQAKSR